MANVTFTLSPPIPFILRQAGAFRHALEDLHPLWERLKPIMSQIEEEQFATEGHGAWPGGPAYHGLVRTGNLRSSLVDPGRAVQSESDQEMVWGSDVFYAVFHQEGTPKMPARPVIDVTSGQRQGLIEPAVVAWVNEVAARTWGAI